MLTLIFDLIIINEKQKNKYLNLSGINQIQMKHSLSA